MATFHGRLPELPIERKRQTRMFSRSQIASMVLSAGLFFYSILRGDVALVFLTVSFFLFMLRPLAEKFWGMTCSNVMKGMAMAMGFGALVLAFF